VAAWLFNAHDTLAGYSRWNPAPESGAGFQRRFPARVATKSALVSSASFQRENMADAKRHMKKDRSRWGYGH